MSKIILAIAAAGALTWSGAAWAVLQSTTNTPDHGQPIPSATVKMPRSTPRKVQTSKIEPQPTPKPARQTTTLTPPPQEVTPPPETPKENVMPSQGEPLTPVPEPRGFGLMQPLPVMVPGELPRRDHVEPGLQKAVERPSQTGIGQAGEPAKRPTATDVVKSLESPDVGGLGRNPETSLPSTPSTRKNVSDRSGTTQRQVGEIQEKRVLKPTVAPEGQTGGQKGQVSQPELAGGQEQRDTDRFRRQEPASKMPQTRGMPAQRFHNSQRR